MNPGDRADELSLLALALQLQLISETDLDEALNESPASPLERLIANGHITPEAIEDLVQGTLLAGSDVAGGEGRSGSRFGRYELVEELGRGGMGVVYRAVDSELGREVALKRLRGEDGASRGVIDRFRHEARAAARLSHPGIVPVLDIGEVEGVPYFTMELVRGKDLQVLLGSGLLSLVERARILVRAARAVHAAHEAGIVHRDLKPSNILVDLDLEGRDRSGARLRAVRVTDFGLAKDSSRAELTLSGQVMGTPGYMSPEQAAGEGNRADRRTDVYGLGAVLYRMLTGTLPFVSDDPLRLLHRIVTSEPIRPRRLDRDLPRDLETIALKALEKAPGKRYQTAEGLADDLDRWLDGRPIRARPISPPARAYRWVRRNRLKTAVAAALLLAVVNPVLYSLHRSRLDRSEAERIRLQGSEQLSEALASLEAFRQGSPDPPRDEIARRQRERAIESRTEALREASRTLSASLAIDPTNLATRESLAESYLALHEEARREGRDGEAALYEDLVRSTVGPPTFEARYAGRFRRTGSLRIETDPPGAEAFLFRFEEGLDTRMVPVPWSPTEGRVPIDTAPLLVTRVIPGGTGEALGIAVGDRLVEAGGLPLVYQEDAILTLVDLLRTPPLSITLERDGRAYSISATSSSLGISASGAERPFRASPSVYAWCIGPANSLGASPRAPIVLPEGSYAVLLRLADGTAIRAPAVVRGGRETELAVELPGAVPRGFVYVPGATVDFPFDPSAPGGLARRRVRIESFFIAHDEVTTAEYVEFLADRLEAGGEAGLARMLPHDPEGRCIRLDEGRPVAAGPSVRSWPVRGVDHEQVTAYIDWRAGRDRLPYRLPTEDEMELAARGLDGRVYPWGNLFDPGFARTRQTLVDGYFCPAIIHSVVRDESVYGIRDLAGNVSEWTSSVYGERSLYRVARGGSWGWDPIYARAAARIDLEEGRQDANIGFRLAFGVPPR